MLGGRQIGAIRYGSTARDYQNQPLDLVLVAVGAGVVGVTVLLAIAVFVIAGGTSETSVACALINFVPPSVDRSLETEYVFARAFFVCREDLMTKNWLTKVGNL